MNLADPIKPTTPPEVQETLERAYTLEAEGNLEEALSVCDSILHDAPELVEVHNLRGIILEQSDRQEEALEAYKTALKLDPHFDAAKQNLLELEKDILEARYQDQRPDPLKVIIWGAIAYGLFFGLAGGLTVLMAYSLSTFPLAVMLLSTSLYAFSSGIGAFVIGKASRFKESLLLGVASAAGCGLAWMGSAFLFEFFRFDLPLLRYTVIGAVTGLGIGLVQKTQRQMIRSIFAGITGFGLYVLILPIFFNVMEYLAIEQFIPETIKFELGVVLVYAFADFLFGCVLGGIIGALFGWVIAHNPVRNLWVVED